MDVPSLLVRHLTHNEPKGISFVLQVSTGGAHTCVLMSNSQMKCFGLGSEGQLGYGDTESRGNDRGEMGNTLPFIKVGLGRSVRQVATGRAHTCALLDNFQVKCFGRNAHGQLGYGDVDNRGDDADEMGDNLPFVDVGLNRSVVKVATGGEHTCVLLDNSQIKCFGLGIHGQLGYEDTFSRGNQPGEMGDNLSFVDLGSVATPVDIATGLFHNCVLMDNAQIKCFGSNYFGQLGYEDSTFRGLYPGDMGNSLDFVDLGNAESVVKVATGAGHTCVLLESEEIKCFGHGLVGQLGYGDWASRGRYPGDMGNYLPYVDIGTAIIPIDVTTGNSNTCVLTSIGKIKCFGDGGGGEFDFNHRRALRGYGDTEDRGDGPNEMGDDLLFIDVGLNLTVDSSPIGASHICTLLTDGRMKCFGHGLNGNLGYEDNFTRGDEPGEMGDNLPFVDIGFAGPSTSPTHSPITFGPTAAPSLKSIDLGHDPDVPAAWPDIPDVGITPSWPIIMTVVMVLFGLLIFAGLLSIAQVGDENNARTFRENVEAWIERLEELKRLGDTVRTCSQSDASTCLDRAITVLSLLILVGKATIFVLIVDLVFDFVNRIWNKEEEFLNPPVLQKDRIGELTFLPQNHSAWLEKLFFSATTKPYDDLCGNLGGCATAEDFVRNIHGPFLVRFVTYTTWSGELARLFFFALICTMFLAFYDVISAIGESREELDETEADDPGRDEYSLEKLCIRMRNSCFEQRESGGGQNEDGMLVYAVNTCAKLSPYLLFSIIIPVILGDIVSSEKSLGFESQRRVFVKRNFGWVQDIGSNLTLRIEAREVELTPERIAVFRIESQDTFSKWCATNPEEFEIVQTLIEKVNLTTCFAGSNQFDTEENCILTVCPQVLPLNSMEWVVDQLSLSVDTYLILVTGVTLWMVFYQAMVLLVLPTALPLLYYCFVRFVEICTQWYDDFDIGAWCSPVQSKCNTWSEYLSRWRRRSTQGSSMFDIHTQQGGESIQQENFG